MRLDKYLTEQYADVTRSQIALSIKSGDITVNGGKVKAGYELKPDDVVAGDIRRETQTAEPEDIALDIVYEDEHLMVINKPRGMVVHPGAGVRSGTVLNALLGRGYAAGLDRAGIVHRLDKNTAGLLMIAKSAKVQSKLSAMFERHEINRTYVGIVDGKVAGDMRIDKNIIRHPNHRTIFKTTDQGGRTAVTHLKVLERFARHTVAEFKLETGRTHQIRVHCKAVGHPIVGDPEYNSAGGKGQMLEAVRLEFVHPMTKADINIQISPTKEWTEAKRKCIIK